MAIPAPKSDISKFGPVVELYYPEEAANNEP